MQYASNRPSQSTELLDDIGFAITAVNHDREFVILGKLEVQVEPLLLLREWSVVPVSVQAGLTDSDHPGVDRELDDSLPVSGLCLGDMVGLDADRGKNACMLACNLERRSAVGGRGADADDLDQTGGLGPVEDTVEVVAEARIIEMGVGIDKRAYAGNLGRHDPDRSVACETASPASSVSEAVGRARSPAGSW